MLNVRGTRKTTICWKLITAAVASDFQSVKHFTTVDLAFLSNRTAIPEYKSKFSIKY